MTAVTRGLEREWLHAVGPSRALSALTRAMAELASYCEHAEHNEPVSLERARSAGASVRRLAVELSHQMGEPMLILYERRIREMERRSIFARTAGCAGADAIAACTTWSELQSAQLVHDRLFHPDVFGMPKLEQLRHFVLHLAKLAGAIVEAHESDRWDDVAGGWTADVAVFGVKLSTVLNERLEERPLS